MGLTRFVAVLFVSMLYAEAPLQQPPRDSRPLPPSAPQLATQAHELYRAQQWSQAAEKYEAALAAQPDWVTGHFYAGNCYDNLYKPSQAGQAENDALLRKAIAHYSIAAERDPDPKMRTLAIEYLVAAYGPEKLHDPSRAVPLMLRLIEMDPSNTANYVALAKMYEDGRRYDDAEAVLIQAVNLAPQQIEVRRSLAGFYNRQGDFAKTMDVLQAIADIDSTNPASQQIVATYYWEKAQKDGRLSSAEKLEYIEKGIDATDKALAIKADYADALVYKNILLRMKAQSVPDPAMRAALLAEADTLRTRAIELNRLRGSRGGDGPARPLPGAPPPPPPPAGPVDGVMPVRVGGSVRPPTKIKHVDPVFPAEALEANIQGTVVIQIVIDTAGHVREAQVLRSVPAFDSAAIDAVRQWEFRPTVIDGVPTPLVMTVTVNFTRQGVGEE